MQLFLYIFKAMMSIMYAFIKFFPTKKQVCFFSRQSDSLPVDFKLIIDKLIESDGDIRIRIICNRFRFLSDAPIHFTINQIKSMYYLATSKVCVLDAYWPAVSMLKHKKSLKVIQLWHSIGKIKQSGYQTVDRAGGRNSVVAKIMCMHKNYDYLIAGGKEWNRYYCEAFKIEENKILNYGLPRLDLLIQNRNKENLILEKYPELQGKIIILYAPTYRKYEINSVRELRKKFDTDKYAFLWKLHPNQKLGKNAESFSHNYNNENTFELLQLCDYLITDYSSLALEGAILDKKIFYYLFDYDRYKEENGLNIDLLEIAPNSAFSDANELFKAVDEKAYPYDELEEYKEKFLPRDLGVSTKKITDLILECLN